jgi:methionyl-tRNA formyltransferase
MRIALIGSVLFTEACLRHFIARGRQPACVVGRAQAGTNADYRDLKPLCRTHSIPYLATENANDPETLAFIGNARPDIGFCLGWSQLLRPEIFGIPRFGTIGFHPSLLPANRGRHPIIWALALGLTETGASFFIMDAGADTGDIVSQRRCPIDPVDDASTLYARITQLACEQLDEIMSDLETGNLKRTPQDPRKGNVWRQRTQTDGVIDWRMPMQAICNLVRALTSPYPGAQARGPAGLFRVWRAVDGGKASDNLEPGRVLSLDEGQPIVKCVDGAVRLVKHDGGPVIQPGVAL